MRVYEVAKQLGLSSKEVLDLLETAGISTKSHMSLLGDEALAVLDPSLVKNQSSEKIILADKSVTNIEPVHIEKKIEQSITKNNHNVLKNLNVSSNTTNILHHEKTKNVEHKIRDDVNIKQKTDSNKLQSLPLVAGSDLTVEQFSDQAHIPVAQIIVALLKWGIVATKNKVISKDIVVRLASLFNLPIDIVHAKIELKKTIETKAGVVLQERPPVVTVIGHVDHGKTTLLDFIRKTNVTLKEKGGITQHLGAYEANTPSGVIVFLDTPGHEAFAKIRQRGVRIADLAILVVAADDGIKPQTIEAIKIAHEMQTVVIVAINKIDRVPESQIDVVKQQLMQYGIVSEEWGGEAIIVPISAKTGQGIDTLLEVITLRAQMMELKADYNALGSGYVLESKIEKGRGPVATIILQNGKLKLSDYFECGNTVGHINSLINTYGISQKNVGPSIPIQISGFDVLPNVGDYISVISKADYLKKKNDNRKSLSSDAIIASQGRLFDEKDSIRFILKADTNSSREALVDTLEKHFKGDQKNAVIVHSGVGNINENDIELAYNTGSHVLGLHVKIDTKTAVFAGQKHIRVMCFDIIYRLLDAIAEMFESEKKIVMQRVKIGQATVIKVFDIKKVGIVAGSYINSGKFVKGGIIVAYRGNEKIGESKVSSLQKDKQTVSEVRSGFECGIIIQEKEFGWQEGDKLECFVEQEA